MPDDGPPPPAAPSSPAVAPPHRRTRRGAERCERIHHVAADLFLARGFDGVSLDDVIARAGGSKTNIYRQFGGKEGLFVAVAERLCDEINACLKAQDLSGLTLEQGLRVLGRTLLASLMEDRHLAVYRLVIAESPRFPALARAWAEHGPETSYRLLADFIGHHSRAGTKGALPPHRGAALFHDMLLFEHLHKVMCGLAPPATPQGIDRLVDEAVEVFLRGYVR